MTTINIEKNKNVAILVLSIFTFFASCKHEPVVPDEGLKRKCKKLTESVNGVLVQEWEYDYLEREISSRTYFKNGELKKIYYDYQYQYRTLLNKKASDQNGILTDEYKYSYDNDLLIELHHSKFLKNPDPKIYVQNWAYNSREEVTKYESFQTDTGQNISPNLIPIAEHLNYQYFVDLKMSFDRYEVDSALKMIHIYTVQRKMNSEGKTLEEIITYADTASLDNLRYVTNWTYDIDGKVIEIKMNEITDLSTNLVYHKKNYIYDERGNLLGFEEINQDGTMNSYEYTYMCN